MKEFLKTYAACAAFVILFAFWATILPFGGLLSIAAVPLPMAIGFQMWSSTEDRVDALEKELQALKKQSIRNHQKVRI